MDAPTLQWLRHNVLPLHVTGKRVLEVGSMDVNGSIRGHVQALEPASYLGVDMQAGPGVDRVLDVHLLDREVTPGNYDLVISTEMLEHVTAWRGAIHQLKRATRPGGAIVLTTRRPGFPRHGYPDDHWRFTRSHLRQAFQDFDVKACVNLAGRGVAILAHKPHSWKPLHDLSHIHPRRAPSRDLPAPLLRAWVKVAYWGRDPDARRLPA